MQNARVRLFRVYTCVFRMLAYLRCLRLCDAYVFARKTRGFLSVDASDALRLCTALFLSFQSRFCLERKTCDLYCMFGKMQIGKACHFASACLLLITFRSATSRRAPNKVLCVLVCLCEIWQRSFTAYEIAMYQLNYSKPLSVVREQFV